ncbi:MAG: TlpA family protein disulfide reductase, partial [Acidobacteria bacterium]|nr:TlpA family protein disulfide reductase [Acidobacteriota bacterium]
LNFWATWCPPCVEEMPSLNVLHAKMESQGVIVLGISMDEDDAAYKRFLIDRNIAFPTYRDPPNHLAAEYGTLKYPETYIIDRDGRFARKIIGAQDWSRADLVDFIQDLSKK